MKRILSLVLIICIGAFCLTGCELPEPETVSKDETLPVLDQLSGNNLEQTHTVEGFEFVTTYNTGEYDLSKWRVTDSKVINMTAQVNNVPQGATVLIEHVHIDMSLKSTNPQLDGLTQDSMDDSYHGTSQDGFLVNNKYKYENKFAIEGFSKDLIDGWSFTCGSYGSGYISQERLTEKNLVQYGNVYGNKMQVVYDILVKYAGEEHYHVVSVLDEFLIPVTYKVESSSQATK